MSNEEQVLREVFSEILQRLFTAGIGVEINNNKVELQIPVKVRNGGTGTDTLTGYVKGSGDSPFTAISTIPVSDISGVLPVQNGGTGVNEIHGYLQGNGASIVGVNSIPVSDISGLGTLALQNSDKVKITGGSISGSAVEGDISSNSYSINSVLPVEKGGTGVNSKDKLQSVLGYATSGSNNDITSLTGLKTPLSVKQGGLGASFVEGYVKGVNGSYVGTATIKGSEVQGDISGNAAGVTKVVPVSNGGTGVTSLSGYVVADGDKPLSAISQIPASDVAGDIFGNANNVTGIVTVEHGGTGLTNPVGYMIGDGNRFVTRSTVLFDDVEQLADMAKQSSDAVSITGGSASLEHVDVKDFQFTGTTHQSYTMTSNMPLMSPVGFMEIKVGNKICKVPYYEY